MTLCVVYLIFAFILWNGDRDLGPNVLVSELQTCLVHVDGDDSSSTQCFRNGHGTGAQRQRGGRVV